MIGIAAGTLHVLSEIPHVGGDEGTLRPHVQLDGGQVDQFVQPRELPFEALDLGSHLPELLLYREGIRDGLALLQDGEITFLELTLRS